MSGKMVVKWAGKMVVKRGKMSPDVHFPLSSKEAPALALMAVGLVLRLSRLRRRLAGLRLCDWDVSPRGAPQHIHKCLTHLFYCYLRQSDRKSVQNSLSYRRGRGPFRSQLVLAV